MNKIRQFISRLHNIYRWIPILWKDRDWDHYYIFEILKTKLKFQSEYFQSLGHLEKSKYYAEQMITCINLIDKVQNEYYIDELLMKKDLNLTDEQMSDAMEKHDRAKRILFKILEENIEKWWD